MYIAEIPLIVKNSLAFQLHTTTPPKKYTFDPAINFRFSFLNEKSEIYDHNVCIHTHSHYGILK